MAVTDEGSCALGSHGFVFCLIVTVCMQLSFFARAFLLKFDKVRRIDGRRSTPRRALLQL